MPSSDVDQGGQRVKDPGRNYDAIFLLGLCVLVGISGLVPGGTPDTVARLLTAQAHVYHTVLALGGLAAIVGVVFHQKPFRFRVEASAGSSSAR